jgi:hypothetical protein
MSTSDTQAPKSILAAAGLGVVGRVRIAAEDPPTANTSSRDEGPTLAHSSSSGILGRAGVHKVAPAEPVAAPTIEGNGGSVARSVHQKSKRNLSGRCSIKRNQTTTRLQRFVKRHGSDMARTIQRQTSTIREKLKADKAKTKWVLHPDKNRFLGRWDMLTSLALIYTATVTPFETSFIPPVVGPAAWMDLWFLVNRCLDVIFLLDMTLQFFVAYQTGNSFGEGAWVLKHDDIIRHYLSTWFVLDTGTVLLPGAFDIWTASSAFDQQALETPETVNAEKLGVLRVLRVLRLVKLARLVRASRLYERWRARITLSSATMTWAGCVFTLLFMSHLFACLIALQATLHSDPNETWMGERAYALCQSLHGHPAAKMADAAGRALSASVMPGCENLSLGSWYLASFCWATMVITGTGGTDFYPSGDSDAETLVVVVLVVIGAFVWTLILAAFCDVATNGNAALIRFRQQLDGLNMLITMHGLPRELAHKTRTYMHQQKGVLLREDAKQALPLLSPALQIEIVLHMHKHWLDAVWFVRDIDAPVKVRLAMAMRPKVLAPKELAPNRQLYVIHRGSVMFGSRMLSHGMAWGDDVILANRKWCLPFLARSMTYSDVAYVTRLQLYELASPYPETVRKLRRATILLALRRALVTKLREHKYEAAHSHSFIKRNSDSFNALGMGAVAAGGGTYGSFLRRFEDIANSEEDSSQDIALKLWGAEQAVSNHTQAAAASPPARQDVADVRAANEQIGLLKELRDSMRVLADAVHAMHQELKRSHEAGPSASPPTKASGQALAPLVPVKDET